MESKTPIKSLTSSRLIGLLFVLFISVVMLAVFYGKVVVSLNTTFFSTGGDGLQSYYNSYYLAKYDTSLMYSRSMNYPFGEVAFYTLSQPLMVACIDFISNSFTDITGYTVGIINFLMLFSIVLAALFLYLLFVESGLPVYYAGIIAVGIAFLSPQIDRFGGHYTLSYVCAIPMLLYLLLRFHKSTRKIIYSLLIGVVFFVFMTGHAYFAAFFAIPLCIYWLFQAFRHETGQSKLFLKMAFYFILQLIVPVIIFYLITSQYSDISPDKPSKPYGFLVYKASPESVFLPLWVDYGKWLHKIRNFNYIQWEGISYVGLIASIGFLVIIAGIVKKLFRKNWKAILRVTDNYFLNWMFWASFVALLYSFGIPFIFGLGFLVDYLGPLQQVRALGRFSWLFFYMVNIITFYMLWYWKPPTNKTWLRTVTLALCIAVIYGDVYFFQKNRQNTLNNTFPSWSDIDNNNAGNQWVNRIDPENFQAIIPLPYYHMGSDNYGISPRCEMLTSSFLVSMKTGLPITAIYLSRASIKQSLNNIALVLEPYRDLEIMKDFQDKRPFLIVAGNCDEYTDEERNLLNQGVIIDSTAYFKLYRLAYDSLLLISQKEQKKIVREFTSGIYLKQDIIYLSNPSARVIRLPFDEPGSKKGYRGNALQITGRSASVLFDNVVQNTDSSGISLSFWFSRINIDLFPKTRLEIQLFNNQGVQYDYKNMMVGNLIKTIDGNWGLIEYSFQVANPGDRVKIVVYNSLINKKQNYLIDELMIRQSGYDVYFSSDTMVSKNNRWYYLPSENKAINEVPGK